MQRYFLHVRNGDGFVPDEEGVILADLEAARSKAVEGARSIMAEEVQQGMLNLGGQIEISDETGSVLQVVPFEQAIHLTRQTSR